MTNHFKAAVGGLLRLGIPARVFHHVWQSWSGLIFEIQIFHFNLVALTPTVVYLADLWLSLPFPNADAVLLETWWGSAWNWGAWLLFVFTTKTQLSFLLPSLKLCGASQSGSPCGDSLNGSQQDHNNFKKKNKHCAFFFLTSIQG